MAVKSEDSQAAAVIVRTRDLPVRQRTQLINALRGHLGEVGLVGPQGAANAARLIALVGDPDIRLPTKAIATLKVLVAVLGTLDVKIVRRAKENEVA